MEDEPIVDEDPHELPFLRMRWRNFERMNLRLAERVDRLRDAQAFGLPGQKQDGIDFVSTTSAAPWAYQVRRLRRRPTAAGARKAFADFWRWRPLNAEGFILCTAREADDRDVVEAIAELRDTPGFTLRSEAPNGLPRCCPNIRTWSRSSSTSTIASACAARRSMSHCVRWRS
jgi:hypothetical protein